MIEFKNIQKWLNQQAILNDLSFTIPEGKLTVLLGVSGSGKSTTLRLINRLIDPDSGEILINGQPITKQPLIDLRRRIGYNIQSVGLFPHWTVAQNIATVPKLLQWDTKRIHNKTIELLQLLKLDPGQFYNRYPSELSGGQQQRVGIARALAADPDLLLMDEPFSALDPINRAELQLELRHIQQESKKTLVLVTHDMNEAITLADYIVLLNAGKIEQQGTSKDFLLTPKNEWVQRFIGADEWAIRALSIRRISDIELHRDNTLPIPSSTAVLNEEQTLKEALSLFIKEQSAVLPVKNINNELKGYLRIHDLLRVTQ